MIMYVYAFDYPLGKKEECRQWLRSVTGTFQAPNEVKGLRSFDNYFGQSPNHVVELEFDDLSSAAKYFSREEIRKVLLEDLGSHFVNVRIDVLIQRGREFTRR